VSRIWAFFGSHWFQAAWSAALATLCGVVLHGPTLLVAALAFTAGYELHAAMLEPWRTATKKLLAIVEAENARMMVHACTKCLCEHDLERMRKEVMAMDFSEPGTGSAT
jgi:hypothetical protein